MLSSKERETLVEIRNQLRMGKWYMLGFIGVGLIGGIPVNNGPLIAVPQALIPLLFVSGVFWSLSIYSFTHSLARSCPRCGVGSDEPARGIWSALARRTFWGSKCLSCGLSFKELDSSSQDAAQSA